MLSRMSSTMVYSAYSYQSTADDVRHIAILGITFTESTIRQTHMSSFTTVVAFV